jgi:hypothetical protein
MAGEKRPNEKKTQKAINVLLPIARMASVFSPAAQILIELISPMIEKQQNKWLEELASDFEKLKAKISNFDLEKLAQDPEFISVLVKAGQSAYELEKHEMLRNGVLNTALEETPDKTRQKLFIRWMSDLTVWHIKVMYVFQDQEHLSNFVAGTFHLSEDYSGRRFDELAGAIEAKFPELEGKYHLYRHLIRDLHQMDLISNNHPTKDMFSRKSSLPELTPLGKEFLKFIESPLAKHER